MKSFTSSLIFIFAIWAMPADAQKVDPALNYNKLSRNDWGSIMRGNQPLMTKKPSEVELRGTPFIFDTYEKGVVIVSDSLQSESNFKFKLNAEDSEIWLLKDDKELVLTDSRIMGLDIFIGLDTHVYRKAILPDFKKNPTRFVEVLYRGNNFTLVKNTEKTFEPANAVDKGVAVIGRNYDAYLTAVNYYILNDKKVFKRIALKKNDIYKANLSLVNKNKEAINAFCNENNIMNPLEEEDAIELIKFLETLK